MKEGDDFYEVSQVKSIEGSMSTTSSSSSTSSSSTTSSTTLQGTFVLPPGADTATASGTVVQAREGLLIEMTK